MAKGGLLNNIQMPKTRRLILLAMKEHGALTADELAGMLNISAVAVRRHLDNLKHAELINYEEIQRGVGRPSFVYNLTPKADHLFPRNYQDLAADIILSVKDLYGQDAVNAIFKKRADKITEVYKPFVSAPTLEGRVKQLVDLRQNDGYMATWEKNGNEEITITELNCPIQHVAEECAQACHEDMALFSSLLDANVTRIHNKAQGDSSCAYRIIPKKQAS